MTLVLGVDSSTQSTKVVVVDAETGSVVASGRAGHPDGTEVWPSEWLGAYRSASHGLGQVAAISVAGQQHGLVALDAGGAVIRPSLLWNDTRSASAAASLVSSRGASWWASSTGSVPVASFTITKLAWLADAEPSSAALVESVLLPHDWLSWQLSAPGTAPFTDRSDASGTGYFSPSSGSWLPSLVTSVLGHPVTLPHVVAPSAQAGVTSDGVPLAAGAGDNAAAALGLGLRPGDVVVSLGTSGTVFASVASPTADASGFVAGFCDAAGGYLPLVCTLNAARVLTSAAGLLGVSLPELSSLALSAPPGAGGLVLLPYLDGERTPNLPTATGSLGGLTRSNLTPANVARAAVEGMLCGLADGLDALRAHGVPVSRILLIGGAAASPAVRAIAPGIFGAPVDVPVPAEYVALGAARQAAWMLSGAVDPPSWPVPLEASVPLTSSHDAVRAAYASYRAAVFGI